MPEGFANRLEANWKLLLAIAELCDLGDRARKAATALSRRADDASLGVELLRDIRDILEDHDRIRSVELVDKLTAMKDRPWSEMPYSGKPITQLQLAKLLKPYGVRPEQVRFGELTFKGYMRQRFETAFRYIPDEHIASPPYNRGNAETTAENSQKRGNISDLNVSAKTADLSQCFGVSPDQGGGDIADTAYEFEERAAILEFDGGFARAEAETQAAEEFPELPPFLRRAQS
jgi:hypothetical protein